MVTQQVVEEYLETIAMLEDRGQLATNSSLAKKRGVSPPTVTQMLNRLARLGLVTHQGRGAVVLTPAGRSAASSVVRKHRLWERFLHDVLGLDKEKVSEEACRLEHATSQVVEQLLFQAVCNSETCPDGEPIPVAESLESEPNGLDANRQSEGQGAVRLSDLQKDEVGVVTVLPVGHRSASRFLAMGFTLGAEVKMIQNFGNGPVVALVRDTRVAMGRGEAGRVLVHKKEEDRDDS